jgi:pseudaminic acid synthase
LEIPSSNIDFDSAPFIIAEMSGNHNGSLSRALKIVESIAASGASAVKLQTYRADTMTLDINRPEFIVNDPKSLWTGRSLFDLYDEAHTPWEWHKPIFERARELGLLAFSSAFDASSVDFLESLDVPIYKIASFENTDLPLIRKVASTGKPMIISTGLASVEEISLAVNAARDYGCKDLTLLKTTSSYPANPENSNILSIPHLRELFNCRVGLSDHTLGIGVAVASVALGASVIEKHVTLDRSDGGVDSQFSLNPEELRMLVLESKRAKEALGKVHYGPTASEIGSLQFRRSIYFSADLHPGSQITAQDVRIIRPGFGLEPKYLDLILGKRVVLPVKRGDPVSWSHLM